MSDLKIVTIRDQEQINRILATRSPKDLLDRECKHATYSVHKYGEMSDMLTIKEYLTFKDGVRVPNIRKVKDYERPYWITKNHLRDHPDKIEFEDLDNLDEYKCTQVRLRESICYNLGYGNPSHGLRRLARSPYLYGLDIGPEVFMKQSYMDRWPDAFRNNHVTIIDAETNMFSDWKEPLMWSYVDNDEIILYVSGTFAAGINDYAGEVIDIYRRQLDMWIEPIKKKLFSKRLGSYPEYLDKIVNMPVSVVILDDFYECTETMVNKLKSTHTDIVTGWNVFFDADVMTTAILKAGKDPADILSPHTVPEEYRWWFIEEGKAERITSSGVKMNLEPQERWHKMLGTCTFKMLDAMQTHYQLRKAKGKEPGGYGLDAIMQRHLGAGKCVFPELGHNIPEGTSIWHMEMQKNHKVHYGVYAIFDSILPKIKDWKDQDMEAQISSLSGSCDYSSFNSQPTVNVTDMHFSVIKKRRKVICSTSDDMTDENDKLAMTKDGWIVTFASHNVHPDGLHLLEHQPQVKSMVYMYCSDADVETTYPTVECILNVTRETTMEEPSRIEGLSLEDQRLVSVNLTAGPINAHEILQMTCQQKSYTEWIEEARRHFNLPVSSI